MSIDFLKISNNGVEEAARGHSSICAFVNAILRFSNAKDAQFFEHMSPVIYSVCYKWLFDFVINVFDRYYADLFVRWRLAGY